MRNNLSRPAKSQHAGFSLIEMMIVVSIISLLLGTAIYYMKGALGSSKVTRVLSDFKSLDSALGLYKVNAGNFPTTQQGLLALKDKPTTEPRPHRWSQVMSRVNNDPWDHPYIYRYPSKKNPSEYEILSIGPDGQEGTDDDINSQDD